uniref:Uncharacterized protein n=1 Tax=Aegilops tauschii subsp. strangulata TaxID=200361 RepID=A0A452YVC3_AEGTS
REEAAPAVLDARGDPRAHRGVPRQVGGAQEGQPAGRGLGRGRRRRHRPLREVPHRHLQVRRAVPPQDREAPQAVPRRAHALHGALQGAQVALLPAPPRPRRRRGARRQPQPHHQDQAQGKRHPGVPFPGVVPLVRGRRTEQERRLELSLQMEKERMESEMKRTQALLDAQQLFVEAFLGKQQPHHKKAKLVSSAAAMEED